MIRARAVGYLDVAATTELMEIDTAGASVDAENTTVTQSVVEPRVASGPAAGPSQSPASILSETTLLRHT